MPQTRVTYINDLKGWELPRSEDLEDQLLDELIAKARIPYFDRDRLGDEFQHRLIDGLRELVQSMVNETLEYWLKGLADGWDGQFEEVAVEFPYLERDENVDPLTVTYVVANEDGTRTELLRTTLGQVLDRCFESENSTAADRKPRARVIAAELRALAAKIDGAQPMSFPRRI
jgi:hypothetical protein